MKPDRWITINILVKDEQQIESLKTVIKELDRLKIPYEIFDKLPAEHAVESVNNES